MSQRFIVDLTVSSTFNLPNCTDFIPWKSATLPVGSYGLGNIPNITGAAGQNNYYGEVSGAFYTSGLKSSSPNNAGSTAQIYFDASKCSAVYSNVDRVVCAYVVCQYCIKY